MNVREGRKGKGEIFFVCFGQEPSANLSEIVLPRFDHRHSESPSDLLIVPSDSMLFLELRLSRAVLVEK